MINSKCEKCDSVVFNCINDGCYMTAKNRKETAIFSAKQKECAQLTEIEALFMKQLNPNINKKLLSTTLKAKVPKNKVFDYLDIREA